MKGILLLSLLLAGCLSGGMIHEYGSAHAVKIQSRGRTFLVIPHPEDANRLWVWDGPGRGTVKALNAVATLGAAPDSETAEPYEIAAITFEAYKGQACTVEKSRQVPKQGFEVYLKCEAAKP